MSMTSIPAEIRCTPAQVRDRIRENIDSLQKYPHKVDGRNDVPGFKGKGGQAIDSKVHILILQKLLEENSH